MLTALLIIALSVADCPPEAYQDAWFCAQREIDLTGDGALDTVMLRAVGPSSDSLLITLTITVQGREAWRERWGSSYELIDPPEFPGGEQDRAQYVKRRLHSWLDGVRVAAFDSTAYVMMAWELDSALIRDPPDRQVQFRYGYETVVALRWDPTTGEFRRLWACC